LFLKPCAQQVFFPFLEREFPHLAARYRMRFADHAYLRGPYVEFIRRRVAQVRARHGLAASPIDYEPEIPAAAQLSLWGSD
jgi:hypothetical protein